MPFDATNFVETVPAPVVETELQRILREAREMIAREGVWVKGMDALKSGRACIATALHRAANNMLLVESVPHVSGERGVEAAQTLIIDVAGVRETHTIPEWNDSPETTHGDVLAAFDLAYELAASS